MKRIFVGIPLPAPVKNRVVEYILRMKTDPELAKLPWVSPEKMHITLQFFGSISDESILHISNVLKEVSERFKESSVEFAQLGAFPNLKNPRVILIHVNDQQHILKDIAEAIGRQCEDDFEFPEEREFVPHLTLCRVKIPNRKLKTNFQNFIDDFREKLEVKELILYESKPLQGGVRYDALERFLLQRS